ncbi:hypothetical protein PQJ75_13230 [Rhodoplanes sp. TEM]|uniref:Uncharacterized protein n=1 Tax=Rhodoplanes tepidamans TaxID=200616 RepID=A0ABT5J9L3_RHOTP|nr:MULTISPECIES: hypothetical protein [Rhodoplanes]MDC7786347.1 hypothetical protein [Rhodoplanes tepidamans]MDC7984694.1 hypothetical protein [Rhodoplanes sp. TEM]MDQ0354091.1 hypothetical protein [Rhodoplanes tepidamans]
MIMAPLFAAPLLAASLAVTVATAPLDPGRAAGSGRAALQGRVDATTDCIVRAIAADPRSRQASADPAGLGELIVDSMPACATTVREMIDAWDASYGDGAGETFFMGPYLDVLPTAAGRLLKAREGR